MDDINSNSIVETTFVIMFLLFIFIFAIQICSSDEDD